MTYVNLENVTMAIGLISALVLLLSKLRELKLCFPVLALSRKATQCYLEKRCDMKVHETSSCVKAFFLRFSKPVLILNQKNITAAKSIFLVDWYVLLVEEEVIDEKVILQKKSNFNIDNLLT